MKRSIENDEAKSTIILRIMSILDDSATAPTARQLRLVTRKEENSNNLFVRLSPGVASDLLSLTRRLAQDDLSTSYPRESTGAWTCFKEGSSDSISFLPLCISFGGNASTFASYNGGICAPYLEKGMWFHHHLFTFGYDERFRSK